MDENTSEGTTAPLPEPIQPSVPEPAGPAEPSAAAAPASAGAGAAYASQPSAAPGYATVPAYPPATQPYAAGAPEYAQVSTTPPDATAPRASRRPSTWVIVTASIVAGVLLLAITFGIGVAVGSHASRFTRGPGGTMMQAPRGLGGERGWRDNGDAQGQNGQPGYDYHGYGGRGAPQNIPNPETTPQQ